jgi:hypothetical protein
LLVVSKFGQIGCVAHAEATRRARLRMFGGISPENGSVP